MIKQNKKKSKDNNVFIKNKNIEKFQNNLYYRLKVSNLSTEKEKKLLNNTKKKFFRYKYIYNLKKKSKTSDFEKTRYFIKYKTGYFGSRRIKILKKNFFYFGFFNISYAKYLRKENINILYKKQQKIELKYFDLFF